MQSYSESEVAGLKAQEAKDYCVELLRELEARTRGPISAGEVQLQELQFELKLKEAESHDTHLREEHILRLKELELEVEKEKTSHAEALKQVDEVRQRHAEVIHRVAESQEKLSIQLERATREHNVKLQMIDAERQGKSQQMREEIDALGEQRDTLADEISVLAELQVSAEEIARLREELADRQESAKKELKRLDEEIESATFEKQKELTRIRREHDLNIAELNAAHQKLMLDANISTADNLLTEIGFTRTAPDELASLRQQAKEQQQRSEQEIVEIQRNAIESFRRQFNILANEEQPIDVTELFYAQKSLQEENVSLEKQVEKFDAEIQRMRTHIEQESSRVATAIEAARTNIQNNIEPGVKR